MLLQNNEEAHLERVNGVLPARGRMNKFVCVGVCVWSVKYAYVRCSGL